jgi:DNA polymerase I-like protein with 3'-5' exonuclease and polymerase domains
MRLRKLPGKDDALLREGCTALGLIPKGRKKFIPQAHIWQLPARFVGPYAEQDPASTLLLFESLAPVLEREGTHAAYRLEVDLLPMVLEMRRRGVRIDTAGAERARDLLLRKRDAAFAEISEKLGAHVGMEEIGRTKWLAETFDTHGIKYPHTEKGNPSFTAGNTGWMHKHKHWLPPLIVKADKYNNAAVNVLETYILGHAVRGRVHAEIHPHRSDDGGTRSLRFSYSNPPLQLMPSRDEELAPLIRGVFLPEAGEFWAKPDVSQQEFRFVVHYAVRHRLTKAIEAAERYRNDPDTDFHQMAVTWTGLERTSAKATNFAKIYGAGPRKFAAMIGKPEAEARAIYDRYDGELPFVSQLADRCVRAVRRQGYLTLYDGARRHWNTWAPGGRWAKGLGPCAREEAVRRTCDPGHPWYGQKLWRADTHKALNALIQGSAARHTKLWMRACWREGIVPLLQMHDALDCSVGTREQAELVAQLGREAVQLEVPMQVDLKFGRSWGDASHTWDELHAETGSHVELVGELPDAPARTQREAPKFINDFDEASDSPPWEGDENFGAPPPHEVDWSNRLDQDFPRVDEAAAEAPPLPPPPPQDEDEDDEAEDGAGGNGRGDFEDFDDPRDDYPHGERDDIGNKVAEYIYRNLKGAPYLKVVKRVNKSGKKTYPQYHLENGQWVKGAPDGPRIPYRLPELLAAPPNATVEICEGEKDADRLAALGLISTTNPGGAGKWTADLNKWFADFARANVYEDNDTPGHKHAADVAGALCGIVPDVRVIGFRELPENSDVSDWLKPGKTREDLLARAEQAPKFAPLTSVGAGDEEIEDYDWVWPGRFALKKIGLITGLPDEGKGVLLSDTIARVTTGGTWPCGEGVAPIGNVILLTAEDDINDTIIPRLMAAGADLKRVHIIKMVREAGKERMFSLVTDLPMLRQKAIAIGNVKMIVIDPIAAYLGIGKMDSFRATDVRAMIGPLKEFAEELRLCFLGIMHFNKKMDVTNLLLRVSDSLAYTAAARHVYGIINDEDNHRKLFVKGKNNIAPREQKTLAFSFDVREVGADKRTGRLISRPYIVWHTEPVDITASEALQALIGSKSPSARDNAKQFIEDLLENGPVGAKDVQEAAKENGISRNTLRRAAEELKIIIKKDGPKNDKGEATWQWRLPPNEEQEAEK